MTATPTALSDSELTERYEQLRRGVLDGLKPRRWQAAVLVQHGMAAWVQAQQPDTRAQAPARRPATEAAGTAVELVAILASVIVDHCREHCHAS